MPTLHNGANLNSGEVDLKGSRLPIPADPAGALNNVRRIIASHDVPVAISLMAYKAFVSSTFEDLKSHRHEVIASLRKAGIHVDPMEDWTAAVDVPKKFSQDRLDGCHLCILLVGRRRGHIPQGETLSITQLEYYAAVEKRIGVLVFLLSDDALWRRQFDDLEKDPEIVRWRAELTEKTGVGFFDHQAGSIEILPALTRWIAERHTLPVRPEDVQSAIEFRCRTELQDRTVRFAFAVALRHSHGDGWFLVRIRSSRHPDSFNPLGGVVHHYHPRILNDFGVAPDSERVTFEDGSRSDPVDLRGLVKGRCLPELCKWYTSNTHERESADVALRRELKEELLTIGVKQLCAFTDDLTFRCIRFVPELYEVHGLQYDFQYRHFTIMEFEPGLAQNDSFASQLATEVGRTPDLVLASADEITRGRTRRGDRIGPYSAYFFGSRRNP